MAKKIALVLTIITLLMISGCSNSSNSSMTKLDKEFNRYAIDAAEELLNEEANSYNTVKVETGKLEYEYTLYNEELNVYEVCYIAKYDADNVAEDEWIEIYVRLTGKTKSVESVDCSYWNATTYEDEYGLGCSAKSDSEGFWYNINLTEEEIEKAKEDFGPSGSLELK